MSDKIQAKLEKKISETLEPLSEQELRKVLGAVQDYRTTTENKQRYEQIIANAGLPVRDPFALECIVRLAKDRLPPEETKPKQPNKFYSFLKRNYKKIGTGIAGLGLIFTLLYGGNSCVQSHLVETRAKEKVTQQIQKATDQLVLVADHDCDGNIEYTELIEHYKKTDPVTHSKLRLPEDTCRGFTRIELDPDLFSRVSVKRYRVNNCNGGESVTITLSLKEAHRISKGYTPYCSIQ